jgi:hypothetical protein
MYSHSIFVQQMYWLQDKYYIYIYIYNFQFKRIFTTKRFHVDCFVYIPSLVWRFSIDHVTLKWGKLLGHYYYDVGLMFLVRIKKKCIRIAYLYSKCTDCRINIIYIYIFIIFNSNHSPLYTAVSCRWFVSSISANSHKWQIVSSRTFGKRAYVVCIFQQTSFSTVESC